MNTNPPAAHVAVTPSDATILDTGCKGLIIGGAGNLSYWTRTGPALISALPVVAGQTLVGEVTRVMSTGTTATNIIAMY